MATAKTGLIIDTKAVETADKTRDTVGVKCSAKETEKQISLKPIYYETRHLTR